MFTREEERKLAAVKARTMGGRNALTTDERCYLTALCRHGQITDDFGQPIYWPGGLRVAANRPPN